jgi:hypothetical protein
MGGEAGGSLGMARDEEFPRLQHLGPRLTEIPPDQPGKHDLEIIPTVAASPGVAHQTRHQQKQPQLGNRANQPTPQKLTENAWEPPKGPWWKFTVKFF